MSKRPPDVSVLTANRLQDGIVVYLAVDGTWVESIHAAAVARSADEAHALQVQGARDAARNLVVEPYLAAVAETGGQPVPARMRERVRVDGPSILGDVTGYVPPSPRAARDDGVRPLAPNPNANLQLGGEGSDPVPSPLRASGEREPRATPVEAR